MDELKLIKLASRGDSNAFCSLYGLYKDRLYRYAFYRLGNRQDAEDAVSACVLSAWKQIGSLREPGAFPSWIFRILSASCGRMIRMQITRRNETDLDAGPEETSLSAEDRAGLLSSADPDPDLRLILQEALERLSEEERNIVLLSVVSGLKSGEIAQICGGTPGSVRSSLSRSLKKLRGYLK